MTSRNTTGSGGWPEDDLASCCELYEGARIGGPRVGASGVSGSFFNDSFI